jgi:hypothetical protein
MTGSLQYMIELVNDWFTCLIKKNPAKDPSEDPATVTQLYLSRYQLITVMILSDDFDLGGLDPVDAFHYVCENTKML